MQGVVNASGNSIAYVGENVNTSDTKNSFSFVGEDSTAQDDGVDISIPGDADAPPAGSVRVGSDCHRQSFTTNPFDSLQIKSKRHPLGCLLLLVEAGGIEPPSENLLIQLSPGGVYLQIFPYQSADRQALCTGSRFVCDLLNGIREVHIYH